MAKTYRTGLGTRLINRAFHAMIRLRLGNEYRHILTVRGRRNPAITLLSKRVTARIFPPARVTMMRPVPCRVPASECR